MCKILFAVLPSKSPLVPAASQYFPVNEAVGHSLFVETWLLSPSLLAYRYQCKARGRLSGRAELSGFLIGQEVPVILSGGQSQIRWRYIVAVVQMQRNQLTTHPSPVFKPRAQVHI